MRLLKYSDILNIYGLLGKMRVFSYTKKKFLNVREDYIVSKLTK